MQGIDPLKVPQAAHAARDAAAGGEQVTRGIDRRIAGCVDRMAGLDPLPWQSPTDAAPRRLGAVPTIIARRLYSLFLAENRIAYHYASANLGPAGI